MKISFILVEPAVPENIGAAARAMKTMGLKSLRMVNPRGFPHEKAWHVAHGSSELLQEALIFNNLEDALKDADLIIGTSAKRKKAHHDYHSCEKLPGLIESKRNSIDHLALVFGREESGLTVEELKICDIMTGIPMAVSFPSLNLSQAVMIYAYILRQVNGSLFAERDSSTSLIKHSGLRKRVTHMLHMIDLENETIQGRIMERIALLNDADANLVLSILEKLERKLGRTTRMNQ